jgi:3-methyladenine DNA glycosylase AlkD
MPKSLQAQHAGARRSTTTAVEAGRVLSFLERKGSKKNRDGMARYGIVAPKVFGVSVGDLRTYAKTLGRDHDLAAALWDSGWYEARMLAVFVDVPALVTRAQMNAWARDFDNWAVCDHACFHLFDRTPHAMAKVTQWSTRKEEFVKRAAFALLASVALHDKRAPDQTFRNTFPLIERAATDDRNFVKKGVSWALRGIGHRNPALRAESLVIAEGLAKSENAASRWIGKDAIRDLSRKPKKAAGQAPPALQ